MKNSFTKLLVCSLLLSAAMTGCSSSGSPTEQDAQWYEIKTEYKPYTRWWWHGSAVDKESLTYIFEEFADKGIGGVEITPIYGVQNNEKNDIDFLSPKWMEMYSHVVSEGKRLGVQVDMMTGTGWPFGGPEVTMHDAANRYLVTRFKVSEGKSLDEAVKYKEEVQMPRMPMMPPAGQRQQGAPQGPQGQRPQGMPQGGPQAPQGVQAPQSPQGQRPQGAPQQARAPQPQRAPQRAQQGVQQKDVAELESLMAYSTTGEIVDLTDKVGTDGKLDWVAGKGEWTLYAVFDGKSLMKVKRAAPGGEGYVVNHYDKEALMKYLGRFDKAFEESGAEYPNTFFNDSFEIANSDWTYGLFDKFEQMHGYKLQEYLPELLGDKSFGDMTIRVRSDYRETISELLKTEFTEPWTEWAHSHGSKTRNQAHGSPANIIDLYSVVDIPECESFGRTEFDIPALRKDEYKRNNDGDLAVLKFASSAAHINGKLQTSSETMTWLTEHFRTSLSQIKPEIDQMFCSGVNHVYFHGSTYSPKDAEWPGWLFYASIDVSPRNPFWKDASAMFSYMARCQSFLQAGTPDCDFLLYWPIYDAWFDNQQQPFLQFTIHSMQTTLPEFIKTVHSIKESGYDVDYISDNLIMSLSVKDGELVSGGGTHYKALVIPDNRYMPAETLKKLTELIDVGAKVVFTKQYPVDVPGLASLEERRAEFQSEKSKLPAASFLKTEVQKMGRGTVITGYDLTELFTACGIKPEAFNAVFGGTSIRRNHEKGKIYFLTMLQNNTVDGWVPLATKASSVEIFDPMTGERGAAQVRNNNGTTEVYLQLKPGESLILKTFEKGKVPVADWNYYNTADEAVVLSEGWTLDFPDSQPAISQTFNIGAPVDWTTLAAQCDDVTRNMATGRYTTTFTLPEGVDADNWLLDLGDVRESARVKVNGVEVAVLTAVPFETLIGPYLKEGENTLEVEVTNLPANRIADYDRTGKVWRIFKDANIATFSPQNVTYSHWTLLPSGLNSEVKLIPVRSAF